MRDFLPPRSQVLGPGHCIKCWQIQHKIVHGHAQSALLWKIQQVGGGGQGEQQGQRAVAKGGHEPKGSCEFLDIGDKEVEEIRTKAMNELQYSLSGFANMCLLHGYCLFGVNYFFLFSFFMPDLACY